MSAWAPLEGGGGARGGSSVGGGAVGQEAGGRRPESVGHPVGHLPARRVSGGRRARERMWDARAAWDLMGLSVVSRERAGWWV